MGKDYRKNGPERAAIRECAADHAYLLLISASCLSLMVGMLIGRPWLAPRASASGAIAVREKNDGRYEFIDPLLSCTLPDSGAAVPASPLQSEIASYVAAKTQTGDITGASVYFRDLTGSRTVSVNGTDKYNPASLLKVPTMLTYYRIAETDPDILSKKIYYDGSFDNNKIEHFQDPNVIVPGRSYTVDELISSMIVHSDNNAALLLGQNVDPSLLMEAYTDLGIGLPQNGDSGDFITVASYVYFFRVLYNSTYLSREYSEKALRLLSQTTFSQGITASVPADTNVSHKFGERVELNPTDGSVQKRELHDCGIVYVPGHPYFLCVMTKGQDFDKLSAVIRQISKMASDSIKLSEI